MMIFVASTLITLERQRQADQLQRNVSSEVRLHLESQINTITNRLNDCADRARKQAMLKSSDPALIASSLYQAGSRETALTWYPQMPQVFDSMGLADTKCPIRNYSGASADQSSPLFTPGELTLPDGFSAWQYVNSRSSSGVSEASIQLSSSDSGGPAARGLQSHYEKQLRSGSSDTSIRLQKSDTAVTLIVVLESRP